MRTDYEHLLVHQDGGVLTITMNRPEVLNAMSDPMLDGLGDILEEAAQDASVRCIVLTGAGRAFGSGAVVRGVAALHEAAGEAPIKISDHSHHVPAGHRRRAWRGCRSLRQPGPGLRSAHYF